MLELWRPPAGAGDPIGCLTTTFTFSPGMFDEQCLARFLQIDSEPDREDLAFLLERETRLGSVYAGVLVDHTQAGVEHSMRWDVLPIRIPGGKQHAKLSLLAWARHLRIIATSANLSEPGYRTNYEIAGTVDMGPHDCYSEIVDSAVGFLRALLGFVPGSQGELPEVIRAGTFLDRVTTQAAAWKPAKRDPRVRQSLIFTLPDGQGQKPRHQTLSDAVAECRRRGQSPLVAHVASPFFDVDQSTNRAAAALCKSLARGGGRAVVFCVPQIREQSQTRVPRLLAPKSLLTTPKSYDAEVSICALPDADEDKNRRIWHAKMLALDSETYNALLIGSANFTSAGLGLQTQCNAEANLLTIVDLESYGREAGQLEEAWPLTEDVADPESAEWLGAAPEQNEEEQASDLPLPTGFLAAMFRPGEIAAIRILVERKCLPEQWTIADAGSQGTPLITSEEWASKGQPARFEFEWRKTEPPRRLRVSWDEHQAFMVLNVEDASALPAPAALSSMTADDMLSVLAASDPSAAFRAWSRTQTKDDSDEQDLDSATPIDLDPLRRHDIQDTFLHRIRRRARVFAQLRANLERPVWGRQSLDWRLRGLIGIQALADKYVAELNSEGNEFAEALLALSDLLIVLQEVDYAPADGSMPKADFEAAYRPFLTQLARSIDSKIESIDASLAPEIRGFWRRVVDRCAA